MRGLIRGFIITSVAIAVLLLVYNAAQRPSSLIHSATTGLGLSTATQAQVGALPPPPHQDPTKCDRFQGRAYRNCVNGR